MPKMRYHDARKCRAIYTISNEKLTNDTGLNVASKITEKAVLIRLCVISRMTVLLISHLENCVVSR